MAAVSSRCRFAINAMLAVCLLGLLSAMAGPAVAQQQDDRRAREAARRIQIMQQQLTQEKAQLEQDKAKLEKENADKDKQIKQLQAKLKRTEAGTKQSEAEIKQKAEELDHLKTQLEATSLKFVQAREKSDGLADVYKSSLETIKQRDAEKEILNSRLAEQREVVGRQSRLVQACEEKNLALYGLGNELLGKYRSKGVVEALKQAEPFTQIERVRMENLWQEYRDKLDAQKMDRPVLAR